MAKPKKKARKANGWGGARAGAGRPTGSGTGPGKDARINRVVAMVSDAELVKLKRVAKLKKLRLGTLAYEIIKRSIRAA